MAKVIPKALLVSLICFTPLSVQADSTSTFRGSPLIDRQLTDLFACNAKADWRNVAANLVIRNWVSEDRLGKFGYHCAVLNDPYEFMGLTIVEICGVTPKPVPFYIVTNNTYDEVKEAVGYMSKMDAWVSSLGVFDCHPRG